MAGTTSTFTLCGRRGTYGTEAAIDFDSRAGNLHVLFWRCARVWKMFSSRTSVLVCFGSSYTYTRTRIHAHIAHAFRWPHNAHIHTCTHTHIHTHFHARFYHTHTHTYAPLLSTIAYIPFTHLPSTYIVAHADPSPSLFSFLHFPFNLYLSFAADWKKLTCGVIRSFNSRRWRSATLLIAEVSTTASTADLGC